MVWLSGKGIYMVIIERSFRQPPVQAVIDRVRKHGGTIALRVVSYGLGWAKKLSAIT